MLVGYGGFVGKCYAKRFTLQDPLSFGKIVSQTGLFDNWPIIVVCLKEGFDSTCYTYSIYIYVECIPYKYIVYQTNR